MPRKELMSWEPAPAYRWRKMKLGVVHRVTCEQLGLPHDKWTRDDSRDLANQWWEHRINPPVPPSETILVDRIKEAFPDLASIQAAIGKGQLALKMTSLFFPKDPPPSPPNQGPMPSDRFYAEISDSDVKRAMGPNAEGLPSETVALFLPAASRPEGKTLGDLIDDFLKLKQTKGAKTYLEIRSFLNELKDHRTKVLFGNFDPKTITEEHVRGYYGWLLSLKVAENSKKKRQVRFKEFIRWLWREAVIANLPRNLDAKEYQIEVSPQKIRSFPLAEISAFLKDLKNDRFTLYALLALNCSMTATDMATLTHEQVDWKKGYLIRKRTKLKKRANAPEVRYKLWPETFDLLAKWRSSHEDLVLTNTKGEPLEVKEIGVDGHLSINNAITRQWYWRKFKFQLKDFRTIGATLVRSHPTLSHLDTYWLANTPSGVTEKHYANESDDKFFELLAWMREKVFQPPK